MAPFGKTWLDYYFLLLHSWFAMLTLIGFPFLLPPSSSCTKGIWKKTGGNSQCLRVATTVEKSVSEQYGGKLNPNKLK